MPPPIAPPSFALSLEELVKLLSLDTRMIRAGYTYSLEDDPVPTGGEVVEVIFAEL